MSRRTRQVGDEVRAEISRLLLREAHDPRIGFVTLTAVEMSPDLRHARVFVSTLQAGEAREQSLEALRSAAGFLRREIARNLALRTAPRLEFRFDKSIETGSRIEDLLREAARPGGEAAEDRDGREAAEDRDGREAAEDRDGREAAEVQDAREPEPDTADD